MTLRLSLLLVAVSIAATAAPSPSAVQEGAYALYIGYRLPDDPALGTEARSFVSECLGRRVNCSQTCRTGGQDNSCPAQCEVAFRECTLGTRGTKFWLAVCPRDRCANGVKALFPVSPSEAVDPVLNQILAPVQPNRFSDTGVTVTLGDACVFRKTSDGSPINPPNQAELCEALKLSRDPNFGRRTALMIAIERMNTRLVQFLLDRGVDPNELSATTANFNRGTAPPLYAAAGSTELIAALIRAGADVDARDGEGESALHAALSRPDAVKLLLDRGADANARDNSGMTPLHKAASGGGSDEGVMALLISRGADVNAVTDSGETPLHWAAHQDNLIACHALVRAGANLNLKNTLGQTPLAIATEKRHSRTALCLKVAGGKL